MDSFKKQHFEVSRTIYVFFKITRIKFETLFLSIKNHVNLLEKSFPKLQ